eukprot:5619847-Alexandrium_andersonii.AAC.1
MDSLRGTGATDAPSILARSATETLREFTDRCWHENGLGCVRVIWGVLERGLIGKDEKAALSSRVTYAP